MNTRYRIAVALGALLIAAGHAFAQTPASSPSNTIDSGQLAPTYVDGSFGFSLTPPAGAAVFRQKQVVDRGDLEIVQFANVDERWSLTVRLTTTTQPLDAQMIIDGLAKNLTSQYPDAKVIHSAEAKIAARDAVRFAASFTSEGAEWFRQQAVVRNRPTEYFALVFVTPLEQRAASEKLFGRIVDSFQLLRTESAQKRIEQALQHGTQLLRKVAGGKPALSSLAIKDTYLRVLIEGKDSGFVQIRELPHSQNGHSGIEIREWAWLFKTDGEITHVQHKMFLTDDLTFENWENLVSVIPPKVDAEHTVVHDYDSGLRQDNQLIVAFMANPNGIELQDKIIEVEPSYASAAWHSLLPRLVDLKKPELYAFSSYHAERRGLALRTIDVLGPKRMTIDGQAVTANKLEDSEGLIPPISETDVNDKGRILRIATGPLEMLPTTQKDCEQRYLQRVRDAQGVLKKYPLPKLEPAHRGRPNAAVATQPEGGR
jgi:hypothetical protein